MYGSRLEMKKKKRKKESLNLKLKYDKILLGSFHLKQMVTLRVWFMGSKFRNIVNLIISLNSTKLHWEILICMHDHTRIELQVQKIRNTVRHNDNNSRNTKLKFIFEYS